MVCFIVIIYEGRFDVRVLFMSFRNPVCVEGGQGKRNHTQQEGGRRTIPLSGNIVPRTHMEPINLNEGEHGTLNPPQCNKNNEKA